MKHSESQPSKKAKDHQYGDHQYGVFLLPEEVAIVKNEMYEIGIGYRGLAQKLNTYVAFIQRFFRSEAALSPDSAVILYDLLGKKPSVEFLKKYALNPQQKCPMDPWHKLYESYAKRLRVIYLAQQEIAKKTEILQGLEKLINEYPQK